MHTYTNAYIHTYIHKTNAKHECINIDHTGRLVQENPKPRHRLMFGGSIDRNDLS